MSQYYTYIRSDQTREGDLDAIKSGIEYPRDDEYLDWRQYATISARTGTASIALDLQITQELPTRHWMASAFWYSRNAKDMHA